MKCAFDDEAEDTILFMEFILKWWCVVNVQGSYEDVILKDSRRSPIRSPGDWQIRFLRDDVPDFALYLRKTGKRCKKLTIDTSDALKYTSIAMSEYAVDVLKTHDYVLLGKVTNDVIEKQFGKYRQSGGSGSYLVTVRNIEQRFRIDNARKYLLVEKH